jgi:Flp pilus assembly pilin Flp
MDVVISICAQATGPTRAAGGIYRKREMRRNRMFEYVKSWMELKTDRRAVTMLEYAIMGSIIAAALVLAVPLLTNAVSSEFTTIATNITTGK